MVFTEYDFSTSRVIVTAAGKGIGKQIVKRFVSAGANVVATDIDLCDLVESTPGIHGCRCDVSQRHEVDLMFDFALDNLGGLDVLINTAGSAGPTAALEQTDPEAWAHCIGVNLIGTYYCMRRALPHMKNQRSGSIVNFSSTAGFMGYPLRTPYCAAKWGVIGLTKSAAAEAGVMGVRVNTVCPGIVEGERMDRVIANEARAKNISEQQIRMHYADSNSLKSWITADDIADTVLFLSSPAASKITGQSIVVDGHTEYL